MTAREKKIAFRENDRGMKGNLEGTGVGCTGPWGWVFARGRYLPRLLSISA
jgi:hypothetical protein